MGGARGGDEWDRPMGSATNRVENRGGGCKQSSRWVGKRRGGRRGGKSVGTRRTGKV